MNNKHTPDIAITELKNKIGELSNSLWIDILRLNKGWSPCIVPEILELHNAIALLLKSEAKPCCGDINSDGCACMQYLEQSNLIKIPDMKVLKK